MENFNEIRSILRKAMHGLLHMSLSTMFSLDDSKVATAGDANQLISWFERREKTAEQDAASDSESVHVALELTYNAAQAGKAGKMGAATAAILATTCGFSAATSVLFISTHSTSLPFSSNLETRVRSFCCLRHAGENFFFGSATWTIEELPYI